MITYGVDGRPKTVKQNDVPSASDTTLYTAVTGVDAFVDRIHVCNKTAGAVTVDVWIDGTANTYLFKGYSIASNGYLPEKDIGIRLTAGEALMVKASAATSLDVHAVIVEISKNTARQ